MFMQAADEHVHATERRSAYDTPSQCQRNGLHSVVPSTVIFRLGVVVKTGNAETHVDARRYEDRFFPGVVAALELCHGATHDHGVDYRSGQHEHARRDSQPEGEGQVAIALIHVGSAQDHEEGHPETAEHLDGQVVATPGCVFLVHRPVSGHVREVRRFPSDKYLSRSRRRPGLFGGVFALRRGRPRGEFRAGDHLAPCERPGVKQRLALERQFEATALHGRVGFPHPLLRDGDGVQNEVHLDRDMLASQCLDKNLRRLSIARSFS
mmetsp:Transcript_38051/g.104692  ORF Transcript_38051/g.104692 Transcript_38051/m.104692 type:complete len:266 (+) Transcript_38051:210-1007(+)